MSDDAMQRDGAENTTRAAAEWVTLSVSIAILALLFGAIGFYYLRGDSQQSFIVVTPLTDEIRHEGDRFVLPVKITNTGERTASTVTVSVALMLGGEEQERVEFSIAFLAGGAIFTTDPTRAEITVGAVSFLEP